MSQTHQNDPLHGITLATMLEKLVDHYGWYELSQFVRVRCFIFDPTIKSSLQFLRRTPWARKKIEDLYLSYLVQQGDVGTTEPPTEPPSPASE